MPRLFTECYLKIPHAQYVDATILKIASVGPLIIMNYFEDPRLG
jgi:hypothetical protein